MTIARIDSETHSRSCQYGPANVWLVMAALVLLGVAMRLACCGKYAFMDESPILGNAINFIEHHTLTPTHFSYPTFFSYLVTIPTRLGALILRMRGILPSVADVEALFTLDSILPILPARMVSASLGAATIVVTFEIGRRFFDLRTGLIAAALLSFSKLHIDYSSYALPDVTLAFFCSLSLLFALYALRTRHIKEYMLAGIFAGLAVSTKYNGVFIVLPLLFVHLANQEGHVRSRNAWVNARVLSAALGFVCFFLIGSPGWLLEPAKFWGALSWERIHMAGGHLGSSGMPYVRHVMLLWCWEKTAAILLGAGVLYAIWRRDRKDLILLALILPSFLYIGSWQKKDIHYLLFIYPALVLLCGRLFSEILLQRRNRSRDWAILLLLVATMVWPVCSSVTYAFEQTLEDSRWVASRWIQDNIQEGSKIVTDWAYIPKLLTQREKNEMANSKHAEFYAKRLPHVHTYETVHLIYSRRWLKNVRADYLITSSYCFDRFFSTPAPPTGSGLSHEFVKRRRAYDVLLNNTQEIGWEFLREFHTRKGPRVLIFQREQNPTGTQMEFPSGCHHVECQRITPSSPEDQLSLSP